MMQAKYSHINLPDEISIQVTIPNHKIIGKVAKDYNFGYWSTTFFDNGEEIGKFTCYGHGKEFCNRVSRQILRGIASRLGKHSRHRANQKNKATAEEV